MCLLVLSWLGCRPEDWDLGAPEVLRISEYDLVTTPAQGTAAHKVEEVWGRREPLLQWAAGTKTKTTESGE